DLAVSFIFTDKHADFNGDGAVDAADIDLLLRAPQGAPSAANAKFDLFHNNNILSTPLANRSDTDVLVKLIKQTRYRDANLDRIINTLDFNALAMNFNKMSKVGWAKGDFNGYDKVNTLDFNIIASNFGSNANP